MLESEGLFLVPRIMMVYLGTVAKHCFLVETLYYIFMHRSILDSELLFIFCRCTEVRNDTIVDNGLAKMYGKTIDEKVNTVLNELGLA